jgi:hypothetical protein
MIQINDILVTPLDLSRFEPDSWQNFVRLGTPLLEDVYAFDQ